MDHAERHRTLKKFVRVLVVIVTWGLVALVPTESTSFFEGIIVASVATSGEYFSMTLDEDDKFKFVLSFIGLGIAIVYLFIGVMGLGGQIILNVQTKKMSFGSSIPIPNATDVHWSYYWFALTFFIFVIIPVFESMIKESKKEKAMDEEKSVVTQHVNLSQSNAEIAGSGK